MTVDQCCNARNEVRKMLVLTVGLPESATSFDRREEVVDAAEWDIRKDAATEVHSLRLAMLLGRSLGLGPNHV